MVIGSNKNTFCRPFCSKILRLHFEKYGDKIAPKANSVQLVYEYLCFTANVVFRNGDIPETTAMETTRYLGAEMSNNPWSSALKHLLYSDRIYRKYSWYHLFKVCVNG